jgi:acyl-CoA thioester hydrolase
MSAAFSISVRVYYEDTDAGGVVYYANYLKFMERARTEWLRWLGFELDELSRSDGVIFAVRAARVEYRKPARFNDLLAVSVALGRTGPASILLEQAVRRDGELLADGEIKIACIDVNTFTPHSIPERIAARVNAWRES